MSSFRPGAVDYEKQAGNYSAGRFLTPNSTAAWRAAITRHLSPLRPGRVLDLGSGTGRFSPLLAEWLNCRVLGVEPSHGMRASALAESPHSRVDNVGGTATAIPLAEGSCDAAWLAYVVHHIPDRPAAARELRRVLRQGATVLVVGAYSERRRSISLFKYFPAALRIVEGFATANEIAEDFAAGGLEIVSEEFVEHVSVGSLREAAERVVLRADSTLQLITDEEFEAGMRALREAAAAETVPQPIFDRIDLLVFRTPA